MSRPQARVQTARVTARSALTDHLVRLELHAPGFVSSGIPDEWVAITVPGQFQTRYYTLTRVERDLLTVDVVLHEEGLVTGWAQRDCVGDEVGLGEPKGSYAPPADAGWVVLAGDLTALPAIDRIVREETRPVRVLAEAPAGSAAGYAFDAQWHDAGPESRLASLVAQYPFEDSPGYFWMAGESAQMREVRRWVRTQGRFDSRHHTAMGYWSGARGRQARRVDPGPIHAAGKAAGKTDEQIWADYDAARTEAGE